MMQSRLAAGAARLTLSVSRRRVLFGTDSFVRTEDRALHLGDDGADPSVYPRDPEGVGDVANPAPATDENEKKRRDWPRSDAESEPLSSQKPARVSSSRLESTPVSRPSEPNFQQKRRSSGVPPPLDFVACSQPDPWATDTGKNVIDESKKEQTMSDEEFFKDRKPSPLSEIEMADTRKPITRATDGTGSAADYWTGIDGGGWRRDELEDTAEEAMRLATETWKANAARGDPETFEHSRILREMRGEMF